MMNLFYKIIEKRAWDRDKKNRLFIHVNMLFFAFAGFVLWLAIGRIWWPQAMWLICFMGYPTAFIGFFGSILFLYWKDK